LYLSSFSDNDVQVGSKDALSSCLCRHRTAEGAKVFCIKCLFTGAYACSLTNIENATGYWKRGWVCLGFGHTKSVGLSLLDNSSCEHLTEEARRGDILFRTQIYIWLKRLATDEYGCLDT
jgi:hypothetical protein